MVDPEFVRNREQDMQEREKMNAAWQKREASLSNGDDSHTADAASHELGPDGRVPPTPDAEQMRASGAKKQPPRLCDCPIQHRSHEGCLSAPTAQKAVKATKPALCRSESRSDSSDEGRDNGTSAKTPEALHTLSAKTLVPPLQKVCSKCNGYKIAQSRRPAFLREWYDTGDICASAGDDQDDVEPQVQVNDAKRQNQQAKGQSDPTMMGRRNQQSHK